MIEILLCWCMTGVETRKPHLSAITKAQLESTRDKRDLRETLQKCEELIFFYFDEEILN